MALFPAVTPSSAANRRSTSQLTESGSDGNLAKQVCKSIAEGVAMLVVLPALALYWSGRLVIRSNRAFQGWSQVFSLIPGMTGEYLRRAFYRGVFQHCGNGATIGFGTVFSHPTCLIGRNAYIGVFCCIGESTIEDDTLIGSHVSIMNGSAQHGIERLDIPIREQAGNWPRITIGGDTWIGDRAIVMADVGRHCVIGAGSVVTKPIPDYAIAVGSPARIVRWRTEGQPPEDADDVSNHRTAATDLIAPHQSL